MKSALPVQPFVKSRSSFGLAFSTHNLSDKYIELDGFSTPVNPRSKKEDEISPAQMKAPQKKLYVPNTFWTRTFALTVIVETLFTVAIEGWISISFSAHVTDNESNDDGTVRLRTFLGLYIFALLCELALSYDALRQKNTFQLTGLCICNVGLLTYGAVQAREIKDTIASLAGSEQSSNKLWEMYRVSLIMVPVFLAVCTLCMIVGTWKLREEFSWLIYKKISADRQMNRRYTVYQVYIALLKFDFFFIFGTQLQILLAVKNLLDSEFIIQAAMVPIGIVSLILAARFCRLEKLKSLVVTMIPLCLLIASFTKTVMEMYSSTDSNGLSSYRVSLSLFAGVAILLLMGTIVNSALCMSNFKHGLRQHIQVSKNKQSAAEATSDLTLDTKSRFEII